MDLDTFISQCWHDHAEDALGVAARLRGESLALVTEEAQVAPLAHLAQHVWGEHLGLWTEGILFLQSLAALPGHDPAGANALSVRRHIAALALASGDSSVLDGLSATERIRAGALAAAALAGRDAPRAAALLGAALAAADTAGTPGADSPCRTLAIAGNSMACTLEEKPDRSAAERELMLLAAQTARRYWALAGTWLETERAEYRLAMSWLQAGNPAQARHHAQLCLDIVQANGSPALEDFFAWEALGRAERAAGNAASHQAALQRARAAFDHLDEADRSWCKASLDQLGAVA